MATLYEIDFIIMNCVDSDLEIGKFMYAEISPPFNDISHMLKNQKIVGTDGVVIINYTWLQKGI